MDATQEKTTRKQPDAEKVQELMRLFPMLDQLMCELILSCSEEELSELLSTEKENVCDKV